MSVFRSGANCRRATFGAAIAAGLALTTAAHAQVVDTSSEFLISGARPARIDAPAALPSPFQPRGSVMLYDRITSGLGGFLTGLGLGGSPVGSGVQGDVLLDDVNIPASRLQVAGITTQMIEICQIQVGVHIAAGAPAGNVRIYVATLDNVPATWGTNEIDSPPILVGTVPTLANSGAASLYTILTIGDGVNPIPGLPPIPLNMDFAYLNAGGGSLAVGVQDQDAPLPLVVAGFRWGNGPDLSFNYYWRYDTDLTPSERGPFGSGNGNASFAIRVFGTPIAATNPVACCVPGSTAAVCFVAEGPTNCAKSNGTPLTGSTTCTGDPCNTIVCCNNTTGVCTVYTGVTACPGSQVLQTGTSCTGITCSQLLAPANDDCAALLPGGPYEIIPGGATLTGQTLVSATPTINPVTPCSFTTTDVWYLLTTPATAGVQYQIAATPTPTADPYTMQPLSVAVYDGFCPASGGSELVCTDFANPRTAIFTSTGSTTYYVRVAYFNPGTTQFSIRADVVTTVACCSPTNGLCVVSDNVGNCPPTNYTVSQGPGSTCTANPCPSGACCNGPACSITGPLGCPGPTGYVGDTTTCSATTPPCVGACCDTTTFACTQTTAAGCTTGTFTALGTSCTTQGVCPAPANDSCPGTALTLGNAVTGYIGTATGVDLTSCSGSTVDVWYSFTPAADGNYAITATPATSSDWGIALALFTGACDPAADSDLDCIGRLAPGNTSELLVSMAGGTTYLIRAGGFPGDNSTFSIVVTQPAGTGACCGIGANCFVVTSGAAGCPSPASYGGDGSTCVPAAQCPPGACCFPGSGTCNVTLGSFCTGVGGTWNGADTTCGAPTCVNSTPGNDDCTNAAVITSPTYSSNVGSEGANNEGLPIGTCNDQTVGGANNSIWYTFTATVPGTLNIKLDNWGTYDMIMAVFTGDCNALAPIGCFDDPEPYNVNVNNIAAGTTVKIMIAAYGTTLGGWNSLNTTFFPSGTCCVGTTCTFVAQSACTAGAWTTGGACTPTNPCNQVGVCCQTDGSCTIATPGNPSATCATGTLVVDGTCSPNTCPPPAGGICCRGATCSTAYADALACAAALNTTSGTVVSKFVPAQSACNTPVSVPGTLGNTVSPCCYADFNHNNNLEVQDIFDFLNDWFAGKKAAIVGGDGDTGTLQVQNIFDFLNAWFAGGCSY
ncbi:MAG TPA: hypothetical protein PKE29_07250 [Phycisphaerales bacterium]|nr:hypothetical protein [Phycisphaerales bacterium]